VVQVQRQVGVWWQSSLIGCSPLCRNDRTGSHINAGEFAAAQSGRERRRIRMID